MSCRGRSGPIVEGRGGAALAILPSTAPRTARARGRRSVRRASAGWPPLERTSASRASSGGSPAAQSTDARLPIAP
ncbi:hypothetical protein BFR06_25375 [Burkholderia pseudomallei]|nr:hypothetical protein BFR05_25355 [Burkholderia pseudomallei]APG01186.1 hypothetical protein BFR06_25375 [Burkholderia pseudomallei]RAQ86728.1 hypothetical protein A4G85_27670 [Burkholderia pseudomallei]